ncbi:MAG: hypothetical protein WB500_00090, partial [Rhodoplanes sp.]
EASGEVLRYESRPVEVVDPVVAAAGPDPEAVDRAAREAVAGMPAADKLAVQFFQLKEGLRSSPSYPAVRPALGPNRPSAKKRLTARVYSCQFAPPVVLFALQQFELAGEANGKR